MNRPAPFPVDGGKISRQIPPRSASSGVVLVIALVALAVMMILLLALFEGATHQIRGAQSDASLAREKMLADSAVALVIGQIGQASSQTGQAWISQPGLLRTYAATASRTPTASYKLYSTPTLAAMTDTSGNLNFLSTDIPANWSSEPSQYTDLNSPVQTVAGTSVYPILDPGALTNAQNQAAGTQVEGLSSDTGAVTMPVAWLYQLQDGTLGPASNGTASNPIVARIAFWTDDDCCKININTAGGGSPWNTPRVNSTDDVAWSTTQPAAGEFSAYPGHPATTSLAVVFGSGANPLSPQQLLGLTPRYAWGGSEFGTQTTTSGESVAAKMDRLYASVDELCFGSTLTGTGQRQLNPVTANQLEMARFVLTAHSESPETTLLGEPRVAIWPVADSTSTITPKITATDQAIMSAATVGTGTASVRDYFFQRNNPLNPKDDFDPTVTTSSAATSNLQLFSDLVNRGNLNLPGYGTSLSAKYPGAAWTQLMLEITDFIHGLNAVDPSPAPFVPFAGENATTGVGRGFVDPLTTTYGSGASQVTLRGCGRCPTLSSLTLVFYVSGFGFKDGTYIDYDETPDNLAGTSWQANFLPGSAQWKNVTSERIRAFVVPCTFQPGCAYPEVSDACTLQISGLNNIQVSCGTSTSNFGFSSPATSVPLGTPLKILPADRAWGGNEGPLTWRSAGDSLDNGGTMSYPFAGGFASTNALVLPMQTTATSTQLDPKTGGVAWPPTKSSTMSFAGVPSLTVVISDTNGNVLQTLNVNLPAFSSHTPTLNGECDHADAVPPLASIANWTTNAACQVYPSWYMCLRHRLETSNSSRAVLIQAGDVSRSVEAATDLRVLAALPSVPSGMFQPHPYYFLNALNGQNGTHAQNLRFADGISACFAPGDAAPLPDAASALTSLAADASYATGTLTLPVHDWRTGLLLSADYMGIFPYTLFTNAPCSVPTGTDGVSMTPVSQSATPSPLAGDWDTGPGFAADGAQVNLPDSGTTLAPSTAYFSLTGGQVGAATQRTPNALVPSPVIFGSLPAGINPAQPTDSVPWLTLLFCPYPAADAEHPGFGQADAVPPIAPDHLVLDNFWMPVVEPYAISTCMATAGKINLNDAIAPFTYLHRNTALHALLDDLRIPAISDLLAADYKSPGTPSASIWNQVDENATIAQIESRFANNSADAYLSESEICTVPLVPLGQASDDVADTQAALDAFWNGPTNPPDGILTGDNLRELPYAQIYSRLTTRSNSYTVHVRVQVLQKLTHDPNQNVWNEGVDLVRGDWRGSYEIERYLDPAAPAPAAGQPLGPYKFRIVSAQRFAP